jgi:hypothetical protein
VQNDEVEASQGGFVFSKSNGGQRYLSEWRAT